MAAGSIARRYARALIDLAGEGKQEQQIQELLAALGDAVRSSRELKDLFENPAYSHDQRVQTVDALCKAVKAPSVLVNFLHLLVDRSRLRYLESIARIYGEMADARAGRVRARVISAIEMKDAAANRLAQVLQAATGREVVLEREVQASILGGVVAHVGGRVFDGSLRTQLEELKNQLKA